MQLNSPNTPSPGAKITPGVLSNPFIVSPHDCVLMALLRSEEMIIRIFTLTNIVAFTSVLVGAVKVHDALT